MKKLFANFVLSLALLSSSAFAAAKLDLTDTIKKSHLDKASIVAVSVRNAHNGAVEYEYNQDKLLHPASVLKLLTLPAALDTLGENFQYETKFAIDKNNNLFVKLSADPLLTSAQLKEAVNNLPKKTLKGLYIDDRVLNRFEWGIGWMWDDETNPLMAKISPYNLNHNILTVKVTPTQPKQQAKITPLAAGTASVVNMVTTGAKNEIIPLRQNSMSPNIVYLYGTVNTEQTVKIPIGNPQRFFLTNLSGMLKSRNPEIGIPQLAAYPQGGNTVYTIKNDLIPLIPQILQNSDNFYSETVFKTAGGVKANGQGNFENSKKMFNDYWHSLGLNPKNVVLADGSGVSRNNLFPVDWVTEALYKLQKDKNFELIKSNMAAPGVGTLKNRLPELKDNLVAKTGTLANNSTLAGYVVDKNGKKHIFAIFVANYPESSKSAQDLQDKLVTKIYNK